LKNARPSIIEGFAPLHQPLGISQAIAMPIYAYKCASCGHAKDVLQKLSDAPLTKCPACGAEAFSKQITAAGFQLKGSGWYVTDFRGGSKTPAEKSTDAAKPAEAGKTESAPAESKPAESKPAESKPAESKPAESKPAKSSGTPSAAGGFAGR
jgi:putative FmdB family regulatory protein